MCFAALWGKVANWIVISNSLSLTNTRKLSSNIGLIGSAAGLFGLAFVECNHTLTIVFLCISCGASGAIYSGWQVSWLNSNCIQNIYPKTIIVGQFLIILTI